MAWQIAQAAEREAWGAAWVDSGHVFTYEDGRPLKRSYVTRLFDKLRRKADLPPMTFHGQRHQQASLQLAAGPPLAVVSKQLERPFPTPTSKHGFEDLVIEELQEIGELAPSASLHVEGGRTGALLRQDPGPARTRQLEVPTRCRRVTDEG